MVLEVHDIIENFCAFRMRARYGVHRLEKSKMLSFDVLSCLTRSAEAEGSSLIRQQGIPETEQALGAWAYNRELMRLWHVLLICLLLYNSPVRTGD